jgi:hypothetical protein
MVWPLFFPGLCRFDNFTLSIPLTINNPTKEAPDGKKLEDIISSARHPIGGVEWGDGRVPGPHRAAGKDNVPGQGFFL